MKWYYHDGTNQIGPFEDAQMVELVKNGAIKHHTQVWKEGAPAWGQAATTELAQYFAHMPPPMTPPPPVFMPPPVTAQGYSPPFPMLGPFVYPRQPPRSPGWMAFASFMIMGLGQILLGQKAKGWALLLGGIGFYHTTAAKLFDFTAIAILTVLAAIAAIDAYMVAKRLRDGKPVRRWTSLLNLDP